MVIGDSAFTLHDFDHHCFDIYKIISEVLFDEELVYSEKYGLSERKLYIMNLAVLFMILECQMDSIEQETIIR